MDTPHSHPKTSPLDIRGYLLTSVDSRRQPWAAYRHLWAYPRHVDGRVGGRVLGCFHNSPQSASHKLPRKCAYQNKWFQSSGVQIIESISTFFSRRILLRGISQSAHRFSLEGSKCVMHSINPYRHANKACPRARPRPHPRPRRSWTFLPRMSTDIHGLSMGVHRQPPMSMDYPRISTGGAQCPLPPSLLMTCPWVPMCSNLCPNAPTNLR